MNLLSEISSSSFRWEDIQKPKERSIKLQIYAVLAAIISTATSLINAISSNLSSDFKLTFLKKSDPMKIVKGMTCLISIGAIFFAFYFDNIVDLLIQSYELSVSCLFIPILIALFKRKGNFMAAVLAMAFGALGFFLFRLYPIDFPKEIASILLSLTGYICGEASAVYHARVFAKIRLENTYEE